MVPSNLRLRFYFDNFKIFYKKKCQKQNLKKKYFKIYYYTHF